MISIFLILNLKIKGLTLKAYSEIEVFKLKKNIKIGRFVDLQLLSTTLMLRQYYKVN